jgi:hypothetical protein
MSNERDLHGDVNRVVRSWLREDRHEDADRVLETALNTVDTTPQRRTTRWSAWRDLFMDNNVIRIGLVAAAVAVIAVIAFNLLPGSPAPGAESSPSSTPTPEPSASAIPATSLVVADPFLAPVEVTLPILPGWNGTGHLVGRDAPDGTDSIVAVWSAANVYGDPCQWQGTLPDPPVGPTVADLATALANQPTRSATTEATTIGGYSGTVVHMSVPTDIDFADCDLGQFTTWTDTGTDFSQRFQQGPGQLNDIHIIDVEGTRVIIDVGHYPSTPAADLADLEDILANVTFQP